MMKRITVVCFVFVLMLSFSACNAREKAEEKVVENLIEDIAGENGDDIDVDIDNGEITIKDDEGNTISIGGTDWPSGNAAELIPEFKQGTIIAVMDMDTTASISIEGVSESEYESYLDQLESYGFDQDVYTMSSDGMQMQSAADADSNSVAVYYYDEDGEMQIIVSVYQ